MESIGFTSNVQAASLQLNHYQEMKMALPSPEVILALWHRAMQAEIGISIKTNEPRLLMQELYRIRQKSNEPELEEVILCRPIDGNIWLVKKATEL